VLSISKKAPKYSVLTPEYDDGWAAHEGDHVALQDDKTGYIFYGQVRLKAVRCGRPNCTKCPHHTYAYARFRQGSHVTEKYLGIAR